MGVSFSSKNWVENFKYLNLLYNDYIGELNDMPTQRKEFEAYFYKIDNDIPIDELRALIKRAYQFLHGSDVFKNKIKELLSKKGILEKQELNDIWKEIKKREKEKKKEKKKDEGILTSREIAFRIMDKLSFSNPSEYLKSILVYKKGFWIEKPMDFLERAILRYFEWNGIDKKLTDTQLMNKLRAVKKNILTETSSSILDFDLDDNLKGLKNGVLDISNPNKPKLLKHCQEFKIRMKIPVKYNPKAKCPKISKLIKDIVGKDNEGHIYKAIGDTILGDPTRFEKVEVLVGEPDTGKTTLLRVVERFLGKTNVCHESLNNIINDKHSTAELDGKLANIYAEVSGGFLRNITNFNVIVSEEILRGNKKYGKIFGFKNRTHHWYACNKLPELREIPLAVMKRICLTHCTNKIELKERIDKFEETILTEKELSGLLNKSLNGLSKLKNDGHYNKRFYENVEEQWIKYSNPLILFMEKYIEYYNHNGINELYEIDKDQLLRVYNMYLRGYKLPILNGTNVLTREVNKLKEYNIKTRDFQRENRKFHVYTNMRFNEKAIEVFNIKEKDEKKEKKIEKAQKRLEIFERNDDFELMDIEKDKTDYSDEKRYL